MKRYEKTGFLFSYIRFMNLSPHGGKADFYMGNTLVCAGIKFGSCSSYIKTGSGPQVYKVTRCGKKDDIIGKFTFCQSVGEVHSLCVCGMADKAKVITIEEPPLERNDYANLRICNFAPDTEKMCIMANDEMIVGDMDYKEQSVYMKIKPGEYEFSAGEAGQNFRSLGEHKIDSGKFYSLYITGTKNEMPHLSGLFTLDAASYDGFYLL